MKKYELVDFLKGYSIFTIIIYHYLMEMNLPGIAGKAINIGGTGIHTFLLLSGFGLYLSFLGKPLGYMSFIRRRMGKVYIPYIVVVSVTAILAGFIPFYTEGTLYAFLGHVFLYKMLDSNIMGSYGGHFWFVSTIIQFYLVFHILAWFKSKSSHVVFVVTGLILSIGWAVFISYIGHPKDESYSRFFFIYGWEFMLGMVIATLAKENKLGAITSKLKTIHFLIFGLVGTALYTLLALKFGSIGQLFNDIPALIGYSCLAIFLYMLHIKPINRFFIYTGDISYSLFLVHILVNMLVQYYYKQYTLPAAYSMATVLVSVVISYVVAHWYNKFVAQTYKWLKI